MQYTKSPSYASIEPTERLKLLINYSNAVEVDFSVPPTRYFRSGLEMVRMANVYYKEHSLENAYILYLKFMTIFLEKIRRHPDFKTVPPKLLAANKEKLREILPKAEKLKQELFEQYQKDYKKYLAARKEKEKREKERREAGKKPAIGGRNEASGFTPHSFIDVEIPTDLDNIHYPDPNLPTPTKSLLIQDEISEPKSDSTIPSVDRSKKPSAPSPPRPPSPILSDDIHSNAYTKSGLRTVIIPSKVMHLFESMVYANTSRNIETCGVLAGKLERNELIITHMILPKQKGTSDSCMTMNEEEIFDYQDQHSLITIGWIHTHPTQTAFLSSVDLHTQCPYQLLMPEAIAIVCAPKYKEIGFFVLTPSHGLKYIANCKKSGFHPHVEDPPLFMVAEHIQIDKGAPLDVLDLRSDK